MTPEGGLGDTMMPFGRALGALGENLGCLVGEPWWDH